MTEVIHEEKNGIEITHVEHPIPPAGPAPVAAPKKKKLAHTNYFLTVSTNERFTDFQEAEYQAAAKRLHDAFYYTLDNLDRYVTMSEGHTFAKPFIKDIYTNMSIERGTKNNHLHLHAIIMISHYSHISVDFKQMKAVFNEMIFGANDPRSVHFLTCWFNSAKETLESYISKNQSDLRKRGVDV